MTKIVAFDAETGLGQETVLTIRRAVPEAEVVAPLEDELADALADAEIFYGFHSPDIFDGAHKLRWIQSTAAGMDWMVGSPLMESDMTITNASGVHAPQVAETAWALTLAISRRLPTYFSQQQDHRWQLATHGALDGATAGIVGLGGIGRRYAGVAAALGMRVLAVDAHPTSQPESVQAVWQLDRLDELLGLADVLLISCPATAETQNLIDARRLALMKPTAILVNIARGGIVNEDALADALRDGRLTGAGLDVCQTEPLPPESPLWEVPNLIITPHSAGFSPQRNRRLDEFFCENLSRYLAGQPLRNVVDRQKGYPVPEESKAE